MAFHIKMCWFAEGHHDIPEYESEKPLKPAAVGAMSYTGASGASYGDRSPAQTAPPSSTQVSCLGWLCMCLQQLLLQLLHREPHMPLGLWPAAAALKQPPQVGHRPAAAGHKHAPSRNCRLLHV